MELRKIPTLELLAELKARQEKPEESNMVLVFGTICSDGGRDFVEMFKEIKTEKDLTFMQGLSLRARFNSHRNYRGFYFKTDVFEKLNKRLNEDNAGFAEWIKETGSVKFIGL